MDSPKDLAREKRFLEAILKAHEATIEKGPRSNKRIRILHGWVKDEFELELGSDFAVQGLSYLEFPSPKLQKVGKEVKVEGMYYKKRVDILISRDSKELGIVSIKFVNSNYKQNAINYVEQQLGETANLRRANIVYGNMLCLTNPIAYKNKDGIVKNYEKISDVDIQKYIKIRKDHLHIHTPNEMAICVFELDKTSGKIVAASKPSDITQSEELQKALSREFSINHFFKVMCLRVQLLYLSK